MDLVWKIMRSLAVTPVCCWCLRWAFCVNVIRLYLSENVKMWAVKIINRWPFGWTGKYPSATINYIVDICLFHIVDHNYVGPVCWSFVLMNFDVINSSHVCRWKIRIIYEIKVGGSTKCMWAVKRIFTKHKFFKYIFLYNQPMILFKLLSVRLS